MVKEWWTMSGNVQLACVGPCDDMVYLPHNGCQSQRCASEWSAVVIFSLEVVCVSCLSTSVRIQGRIAERSNRSIVFARWRQYAPTLPTRGSLRPRDFALQTAPRSVQPFWMTHDGDQQADRPRNVPHQYSNRPHLYLCDARDAA